MSKKTTMTDLCAYLTTFFCSISQGLNREKRRVPFADTIGTAVQTALPFWAQRIESYNIMVSPYALCFIQHFQSSTSFLTESSFISTRCLFSPPLFTENCGHWGFWLNKDRTYKLVVSRTLMVYLMNNHLTICNFFQQKFKQDSNLRAFSCLACIHPYMHIFSWRGCKRMTLDHTLWPTTRNTQYRRKWLSVWTTVTGYLKITFQTCQQWQKSDLIERWLNN